MGSPYRYACCEHGWPLKLMGWGLFGVVVEVLLSLWSLSCESSGGLLEPNWHLMARERGSDSGTDAAYAQWKRRRRQSRMVNRWKALRRFW